MTARRDALAEAAAREAALVYGTVHREVRDPAPARRLNPVEDRVADLRALGLNTSCIAIRMHLDEVAVARIVRRIEAA